MLVISMSIHASLGKTVTTNKACDHHLETGGTWYYEVFDWFGEAEIRPSLSHMAFTRVSLYTV